MLPMLGSQCPDCPIVKSLIRREIGTRWGDGFKPEMISKAERACTEALNNGECPFYVSYEDDETAFVRTVKMYQRSI